MSIKINRIILLLFVFLLPRWTYASPINSGIVPGSSEWRKYDINADGKFDKNDINELIDKGWQTFDNDLNDDGKKDVDDVLALFLKLSVMDRNCDREVNDKDYQPVDHVSLPDVPDIQTIRQIVNECVIRAKPKLPPDIEEQAFRSIPADKKLTIPERAYVYEIAGLSGLAQLNLDAAKWGYGRSFQTYENSPGVIGSLAFCLMADDMDTEALLLLAFAKDMYPESAATATSLGWIFARHGQNDTALEYFQQAISFAPKIAQYYMNLGIMLMRVGSKREAWEAFKKATDLDPADSKKLLFWYITKPPDQPPVKKPFDPEEFSKQTEIEIEELKEQGFSDDEIPEPWDQLSPCDQARRIPELLEAQSAGDMEKIAQGYADDLAKDIEKVIKEYWPQWKNMPEDWNRYVTGIPVVWKSGQQLTFDASVAAGNERASLTRQMGGRLLGYSSFFMESALKEARSQADMTIKNMTKLPLPAQSLAGLKEKAYKDALEEAIRNCYKAQIDQAYAWMTAPSEPYNLPEPKVKVINTEDYFLLFMVIPLECLNIEGYCPEGQSVDTKKPEIPGDNVISIDLLIVSFKWNTDTDEMEFNVGEGIIVGATWSPKTGFGAQVGFGFHGVAGPIGGEAAVYARFDEGKCRIETEFNGSLGFGPVGVGKEVKSTQATFELP